MWVKSLRVILFCLVTAALAFGDAQKGNAQAVMPGDLFLGRLVKVKDQSAVYYVDQDGQRHAFPNAKIFFSWYDNFSSVEVISNSELARLPLGRNVLYRPGTRLVKLSDVPEVYAVEPGGVLRNIPSEAAAKALYGPDWSKLVDDLDISFFFDYDIGGVIDVIDGNPLYPRGTFVSYDGAAYVVDKTSDGIFWLRPEGVLNHTNGFHRVQRYSITDPNLREFYEIGLPMSLPQSPYACTACDPFWARRPAQQMAAQSFGNGRYTITIPTHWGSQVFAPDFAVSSEVFLAMESITDDAPRLSVVRRPRQPGQVLPDILSGLPAEMEGLGYREYRNASSAVRIGAWDYAGARFAENGTGRGFEFVWLDIFESEAAFYEVKVSGPLERLTSLEEIIYHAIRSFTINEAVPE